MSRFFGAGGACGGKDGAGGWPEWPVHMKCLAVEDRARWLGFERATWWHGLARGRRNTLGWRLA
jgi:hypothetical protein